MFKNGCIIICEMYCRGSGKCIKLINNKVEYMYRGG